LPGKNLRPLLGRSLLEHTIDFIRTEGMLEHAVLSTDDAAIAAAGAAGGLSVPFMRPAALATDRSTSFEVVRHALDWYSAGTGLLPDNVALLQVTTPYRRPGLLRDALALLAAHPEVQSVIGMQKLSMPSNFVFRMAPQGTVSPLDAEGQAILTPTGSVYLARTQALLEQGRIYAQPIKPIITPDLEAIDIDTEDDFRAAEAILGPIWLRSSGCDAPVRVS
jgi:CMP-N-acetylneuraminic acid synthetase